MPSDPPLRATWTLKGTQAVVPITGANAKRVLFGAINLRTAHRVVLIRRQAGQLDAQGTAAPGDDVIAAVKATMDAYLAQAVVGPLFSGQPVVDLSGVLSAAALQRFQEDPAARATLADEGLPPASKGITATRANMELRSVAGPDGVPAVVAARLDLLVHAVGPTLDVDINRYGDVTLVADEGGWRIDSFQLKTTRDSRS